MHWSFPSRGSQRNGARAVVIYESVLRVQPKIFHRRQFKINSRRIFQNRKWKRNKSSLASLPAKCKRFSIFRYFREFSSRLINCWNGHSYAEKCFVWYFPGVFQVSEDLFNYSLLSYFCIFPQINKIRFYKIIELINKTQDKWIFLRTKGKLRTVQKAFLSNIAQQEIFSFNPASDFHSLNEATTVNTKGYHEHESTFTSANTF